MVHTYVRSNYFCSYGICATSSMCIIFDIENPGNNTVSSKSFIRNIKALYFHTSHRSNNK